MPGQLPQVYNNPPASVEGDELATLRWLLARLNSRSRRHPDLSGVSESEAEVSHAALILLELARAYARGVLAICRTANAEAAYPVARSLVETWAEFRYLMQPGNRLERVHRMLVSAALAMRDEISNDESLSELREKHPTAFAEVESIRKKNRMAHYSGKSRKRLIAEMCGDGPGKSYAPLSWESHPIIQVYMNELQYHHRAGARRWRARNWSDQAAIRARVSLIAYTALLDIWNVFAKELSPQTKRVAISHPSRRKSK